MKESKGEIIVGLAICMAIVYGCIIIGFYNTFWR